MDGTNIGNLLEQNFLRTFLLRQADPDRYPAGNILLTRDDKIHV